jgi:iron complex transport system substrate-binding protein
VALAPDAVVIAWCGVPLSHYRPEVVLRRPSWQGLRLVREGRVVPISEALLGRPGPRLIEGLAALRSLTAELRGRAPAVCRA